MSIDKGIASGEAMRVSRVARGAPMPSENCLVVKEKKSNGERKQKISHNHSIGMTINGRNLPCGFKLLFSFRKRPTNFTVETMLQWEREINNLLSVAE